MSAVIDTLVRVCIGAMSPNVDKLRACDPNGAFRDLAVNSIVYATDTVHLWMKPGAGSPNPTADAAISFWAREGGEWGGGNGFGIGYGNESTDTETDTLKRWIGIIVTGDETNSHVSLSSTPDWHTWRIA